MKISHRSLPAMLAILGFTFHFLISSVAAQEKDSVIVRRSLDVQPLESSEYLSLSYRKLLFATNRKVMVDAETTARDKRGGSYRYDKVFSDTLDPSLAFGWVEVGYPSDREFGSQNYEPNAESPNPFLYFSITSFGVVGSRSEAHDLAANGKFDTEARALVYVHGINNSFRDGAEQLTQLIVDLNIAGTPLLFSWPSEVAFLHGPDSYRKTLAIARRSEIYLSQAIDDILPLQGHFDLLAHSMGTLMAFEMLRRTPPNAVVNATSPSAQAPSVMLPNVILAAPDIGKKDFVNGREGLIRVCRRLTVYCGMDKALYMSGLVNGDDRIGYCDAKKPPTDYLEGVEFVRVYGTFNDIFNHSYYVNTPAIVADLKRALSLTKGDLVDPRSSQMPYREIFIHN